MLSDLWSWILIAVFCAIPFIIIYFYIIWCFYKSAVREGVKEAIAQLIANNVINPESKKEE